MRTALNLAIATLVAGGSIGMLRKDFFALEYPEYAIAICMVWIALFAVFVYVVEVLRIRDYVVPKTLEGYYSWMKEKRDYLIATGESAEKADSSAREATQGFMIDDYCASAESNRNLNLIRQKSIATMSYWLIGAAFCLLLQAAIFGSIVVRKDIYGQRSQQSSPSKSTNASKAATSASTAS